LPNDVHPAQAGARKIADAVVLALAPQGVAFPSATAGGTKTPSCAEQW